jgi:hypothetical protein
MFPVELIKDFSEEELSKLVEAFELSLSKFESIEIDNTQHNRQICNTEGDWAKYEACGQTLTITLRKGLV